MSKIKILHDNDGEYGYPVGVELSTEELLEDFRNSDICSDELYKYLCGIPIPAAVDQIAEMWGLEYVYV